MLSKILNNRFLTLGAILLIATGVIGLAQYFSSLSDGEEETEFESSNPNYLKLKDRAIALGTQKWNKSAYNLIRQNIRDYAGTKPDPLITAKEESGLNNTLEGKYLLALDDTIKQFCQYGRNVTNLRELENEISQFNSTKQQDIIRGMRTLIQAYYNALGMCSRMNYYTRNERYNKIRTDNFLMEGREYQTKEYFQYNEYLQAQIAESLYRVTKHSTLEDNLYETISNSSDCREFSGFEYYQTICDSIIHAPIIPVNNPDSL